MILELDIGNSRIKWRRMPEKHNEFPVRGINDGVGDFLREQANYEKPSLIRMSNVSHRSIARSIAEWTHLNWNIKPVEAAVMRRCGRVKVQYSDISRLGVDRWLAMLAAFDKSNGPCLIVDCGTAFTLDILSEEGMHLGGFILPGLRLMADILVSETGIRLDEKGVEPTLGLGNSTHEAVVNGAVASLVALIEKKMGELAKNSPDPRVYITGGDAALLAALMNCAQLNIEEDLVLDGLVVACAAKPDTN